MRGLSWEVVAKNVIAGIENPLNVTAVVNFVDGSRDVVGENLWRFGMFGSRERDGSGEKFNYNRQTLNEFEASYPLRNSQDLRFQFARASFDIAAIGCTDFQYVCGEFTKADSPNPDFTFSVYPSGDTQVLCKRYSCRAGKPVIFAILVNFCTNVWIETIVRPIWGKWAF